MPHIYLAQWEWHTPQMQEGVQSPGHWHPPGGDAAGALDLRSIPQMSAPGGTPEGYGLFTYDTARTGLSYYLGDDLERNLSSVDRSAVETLLGLAPGSVMARSVLGMIRELLLAHADATGQSRWRPLRGSPIAGFSVRLGGYGRIIAERFSRSHPAWGAAIAVYQEDYRRNRSEVAAGRTTLDALRRQTGYYMQLLGISDALELLPPEYAADGFLEPRTTIADSFNRADSASLGSSSEGWSWAETQSNTDIVSNKAQARSTGVHSARAESDLSSDDHYAQCVATHSGASSNKCGVAVRFASGANTYYKYQARPAAASVQHEIIKVVTGTETSLFTQTGNAFSSGDTIKLEVDSANLLQGYVNGVSRVSGTDSSISGNLRTGLAGEENVADRIQWDDFQAADLAASAPPRRRPAVGAGWATRR